MSIAFGTLNIFLLEALCSCSKTLQEQLGTQMAGFDAIETDLYEEDFPLSMTLIVLRELAFSNAICM
jgi:hypothetical protein